MSNTNDPEDFHVWKGTGKKRHCTRCGIKSATMAASDLVWAPKKKRASGGVMLTCGQYVLYLVHES